MTTGSAVLAQVRDLVVAHRECLLGGEVMPEDALAGVVPSERLLDTLTLGMSLNYQRNSYALWQAVAAAYQDPASRWVFAPAQVLERDPEDLARHLLAHRVALQPNRHPAIWRRVARGIAESSADGDVLGLLTSAGMDIGRLGDIVQVRRKPEFPYLSGPKIFNYWLYVLEQYAGVRWTSRELITIAPDTHVIQATVRLGLCGSDVLEGSAGHRAAVARSWAEVLAGSALAPIDVHTPLWLWSRAGFPDIAGLRGVAGRAGATDSSGATDSAGVAGRAEVAGSGREEPWV
ncbi:hypothetical protein [Streptomyces sp. ISL-11]|uniref:hypothetical protein n=1 Tax=Streptomyces sp. ISL-11 TaxID=2819174 RepID=UPI001BE9EDB4|nr:hypothetical protein [Streptomyces sp. ISL-11]MBT2385299.1 hypothetical protein [Streptomyces sp. ISL-11]